MKYIFATIVSLGILSAQENEVILPVKSDAGYLKIGLPGGIDYSRFNGPDFCVYNIVPHGLGGGWTLSIYEGDHPNTFSEYRTIKIIKVESHGKKYDVEIRDTKRENSILCLLYFPFGHKMRLNENGIEMPTKDENQLQFMLTVPDEKSIQPTFEKLKFDLVN